MIDSIDTAFGDNPLEQMLSGLTPGTQISSAMLLTVLDTESEELLEEAFLYLAEKEITVDISDLPVFRPDGQAAARLYLEEQIHSVQQLQGNLEADDPLQLYLEELAGIPVCGDIHMLALALAEANQKGQECPEMGQILNLSLSRVVELAFDFTGHGLMLLDLIQEGSMGLWESLCRYTEGDIETFRDARIRFAMTKAVVLQAYASGVGQRLRTAVEDYRSVDERLLGELGRNPTQEELAEALHMSVAEVSLVGETLQNARNMSRMMKTPEEDEIPQEEDQAVEDTAYFQMRQRIAELLSGLSKEDAKLLKLRYGLEGGVPQTPQQVAEKLGIPVSQVAAREAEILIKLRQQN